MIYVSDLLLISVVLFTVLYWYLTKHFTYWKLKNIPYKNPLPLFGNLYDVIVKGKPLATYFAKLYNEYEGPYYGFFGINKPFLIIKDPKLIKRVLVTDFHAFQAKTFIKDENIDPIFSNALFTQKNAAWAELRSKLTPIFTSGKLKGMFPLIEQTTEDMLQYIILSFGTLVDVKDIAAKYSVAVIANCAFGIQISAFTQEKCEFVEAGKRQFLLKFSRILPPLAYIFAHPLVKLFRLKFVDAGTASYFRKVFTKAMNDRENTNLKRNDLIDTLLFLKRTNDEKAAYQFTDDRLAAQAVIFYVAGNEAISNAISLTLLELAVYPEIQNKLRKEVKDCINQHGVFTYAALQDAKYLHMVIFECFRKYPFTAFGHRRCTENYLIKETGLVLESGLNIIFPIQALHWDPKYFPNPDVFDPERFSDENKPKLIECTYLPFGGGPRSCIANRFALLTIEMAIARIIQDYHVEKAPDVKYPVQFGISYFQRSADKISLIFTKV